MKESRNVNQANGNALINAADISRHYTMADGTGTGQRQPYGKRGRVHSNYRSERLGKIHADEYSRSARHLRQRNIYVFRT